MNDFVERCLREWRRIGVPEAAANEMAADLDADLRDAAADDVAPEEVLGNGIFDAASFARSWAAARGLIPPAHIPVARNEGRRIGAIVLAVLAVLGAGFLALAIFHPTAQAVAVKRPAFLPSPAGPHPTFLFPPSGVVEQHASISAPLGIFAFGLVAFALLAGGAWIFWHRRA